MFNLVVPFPYIHPSSLDAALRAQFGARISGLSHNGADLTVYFFEQYTPADETALQAILDAHDPVMIVALRDGSDISVLLGKPYNVDSATELTLTIDGTPVPTPATLDVNNQAEVFVNSADEITLGIVEAYPHLEVVI